MPQIGFLLLSGPYSRGDALVCLWLLLYLPPRGSTPRGGKAARRQGVRFDCWDDTADAQVRFLG